MSFWGYHAMFDCARCDVDKIANYDNVYNFSKEIVSSIKMKAYGEPNIVYFAEDQIDKAGYTLVQLIETSSITGHFIDSNGDAYIDIFSCKNFDVEIAADVIKKYFNPKKIRINFITRQAG